VAVQWALRSNRGVRTVSLALAWLRVDLRRRSRSLLVLSVLVALSSGLVLTGFAGARRGDSAVDRLLAVTLPATATVRVNRTGFDWSTVRALPEVAALTTYAGYSGFAVDEAPADPVQRYAPMDLEAMRTIERPVVLAGRLVDPTRADEAVVTSRFVKTYGRGVGELVTVRLFSPAQVSSGVSATRSVTWPRPQGPAVRVRIVGVVRSPWFRDDVGAPGGLIPSPALAARYPASFLGATGDGEPWALVRLHNGDADLETFRGHLTRLVQALGAPPDDGAVSAPTESRIDLTSRTEKIQHLREVTRFQAICLLAFATAALIAAMTLLGLAITRHAASVIADLTELRALGMTRTQVALVPVLAPTLAGAIGVAAGLAASVPASHWMPFGAAALVEPSPGPDVDWPILAGGGLTALALVAAGTIGALGLSAFTRRNAASVRRSTLVRSCTNAGLPVPVLVGVRFALEAGRGSTASPVRSALTGAVAGVTGVVAAFTFSAGVADADNPARFGQTHQAGTGFGYLGQDLVPSGALMAELSADPDVVSAMDLPLSVAEARGHTVITFSYQPTHDVDMIVLTHGNAPRLPTDVVIAPTTARQLDAGIGSIVTFMGDAGTSRLRVTGFGFVPQTGFSEYDSGAWVTPEAYRQLFAGFLTHEARFALRPGADVDAVLRRLETKGLRVTEGAAPAPFLFRALLPSRLAEIRDIRGLPVLLGLFLAVLALGTVGHALAAAVRRRRKDLAVLRALGMTRRASGAVVGTHASVLAAAGLAFGVPLGMALGRVLWHVVADSTPMLYRPPVPTTLLIVIGPVTLIIANLLAAPAWRQSRRQRISDALRAE
jgi:hypothetical protein